MAVVYNVEFVSTVHPSANVYTVLFDTEYDINNVDVKNQISTFVFSNKDESSVIKMKKETDTKYTAKFLQSFDSLESLVPVNLKSDGIYYTYVVIDSRNTEEKNKTAIHVYLLGNPKNWWRLEFTTVTNNLHNKFYWRGCEIGAYDSEILGNQLTNTVTPTAYCTARASSIGDDLGPAYEKTECIVENVRNSSDISIAYNGEYGTVNSLLNLYGHDAESINDADAKIIFDFDFEQDTNVRSVVFTDGTGDGGLNGGVGTISIYYSPTHHANSTAWILHGTYNHEITNDSTYINVLEYNGSEWVLNGTYNDIVLKP